MASMWRFGSSDWKDIFRKVWRQLGKDRVLDRSAMLSFYFLLSLFPFLLFLVALLGLVMQKDSTVHFAIQDYLTRIAPASVSKVIDSTLHEISGGSNSGALSLSLLFSLWVASSGLVAIMEALNVAYEAKESRPWWKQRLVAIALTIGLVLCFGGALILIAAGDWLVQWVTSALDLKSRLALAIWRGVEWLLLIGFLLMAFNGLYVFAPNVKHQRWHWLMPGTVVALALWLLGSYGFKLYLQFFNTYSRTYGSIAAVVILLLWFYLSGIAILLGGELNCEIEKRTGRVNKV